MQEVVSSAHLPSSGHRLLLALYTRAERLVAYLPKPLREPVLKAMAPLKQLFLLQRPPCLLVCGDPDVDLAALLNALAGGPLVEVKEAGSHHPPRWRVFAHPSHCTLRVLDERDKELAPAGESLPWPVPPDLFLFVRASTAVDAALAAQLDRCEQLLGRVRDSYGIVPAVVAVQLPRGGEAVPRALVEELRACVASRPLPGRQLAGAMGIDPALRLRLDGTVARHERGMQEIEALAELLTRELPDPAKLEMARLTGARSAQAHIAQKLVNSTAAVCGAIGAQPIPLGDFPILTALQVLMVTGVIYISGRPLRPRLAAEFLAALGLNVGAGLLLREAVRGALKVLPGWGNALSGAVAAAGTYGVGRAAIGYFIEGLSLQAARQLLRRTPDP